MNLTLIKSIVRTHAPSVLQALRTFRRWHRNRQTIIAPSVDSGNSNNVRVLIDVTHTANADFVSGIQRVVWRLTNEMVNAASTLPFEPTPVKLSRQEDGRLKLVGAMGGPLDEEIRIRRNDILLMLDSSWEEFAHFARSIIPVVKSQNGIVVSCLYDLIPLTHPQFCDRELVITFSKWFPVMLRNSDAIICISDATRNTFNEYITKHSQRFDGPVTFFHLGADFQTQPATANDNASNPPTVLMVGTLEPRKGHSTAIDAFERLWASGNNVRLQIVGKNGWIDNLVERIKSHPQFGKQLLLNLSADDAELRKAYMSAKLLLSASLVEGFGLPLVEAAALGKSLIVSDIPSSREVCGTNAIYFRAGDPVDLALKLEHWVRTGQQPPPPNYLSWAQSAAQMAKQLAQISTSRWSGNRISLNRYKDN